MNDTVLELNDAENIPLRITAEGYLMVTLRENDGGIATPATVEAILDQLKLNGLEVVSSE